MYLRLLKTSRNVVNSEVESRDIAQPPLGFDHALHPPTQNLVMSLGSFKHFSFAVRSPSAHDVILNDKL